MKHTPGPWTVIPRYTDRNAIPIGYRRPDGAVAIFAEVNGGSGISGQTDGDANAALIAAAPDLLAAARAALAEVNHCQAYNFQHPTLRAAAEHLRAAVDRATLA